MRLFNLVYIINLLGDKKIDVVAKMKKKKKEEKDLPSIYDTKMLYWQSHKRTNIKRLTLN